MYINTLYVNAKRPPYCKSKKTLGDDTYDYSTRTYTPEITDILCVVPEKCSIEYQTTYPWSRITIPCYRTRDISGVSSATVPEAQPESIFSLDGKKLDFQQKGLNIIRYKDGTTRKVMK